MIDRTRELTEKMRKGARDFRQAQFGPLIFTKAELDNGIQYAAGFCLFGFGFQVFYFWNT